MRGLIRSTRTRFSTHVYNIDCAGYGTSYSANWFECSLGNRYLGPQGGSAANVPQIGTGNWATIMYQWHKVMLRKVTFYLSNFSVERMRYIYAAPNGKTETATAFIEGGAKISGKVLKVDGNNKFKYVDSGAETDEVKACYSEVYDGNDNRLLYYYPDMSGKWTSNIAFRQDDPGVLKKRLNKHTRIKCTFIPKCTEYITLTASALTNKTLYELVTSMKSKYSKKTANNPDMFLKLQPLRSDPSSEDTTQRVTERLSFKITAVADWAFCGRNRVIVL